jgi:hypothetical protein
VRAAYLDDAVDEAQARLAGPRRRADPALRSMTPRLAASATAAARSETPSLRYFDRTWIDGYSDGKQQGIWRSYVKGGCVRLLHFNHKLTRTAP